MPKQIPTLYEAYEFSDNELDQACVFSDLQEKWIRTQLANYVQSRAVMTLDPDNLYKTFGMLEYARGAIEAISHLLSTHDAMRQDILVRLQEELSSQPKIL